MRSRYETARRILVFWTLFIGIGAVGGAAMMLLDPSGKTMGMDGMLPYFQVLPFAEVVFQDLAFSGIALFIVNGLTNLAAAGLLLARKKAGVVLGGIFGVTLMLWICIQFYIFPPNFMSTIYFIFGFCQAAAGYAAWVFRRQESFTVNMADYPHIGSDPTRLVAYFSRMGYGKKMACEEAERTGAALYEVRSSERTEGTLGFWWCGRYGMHRWAMPIQPVEIDLSACRHVTIVSPIWVFALAAPMRSFCQAAAGVPKSALAGPVGPAEQRVSTTASTMTSTRQAAQRPKTARLRRFLLVFLGGCLGVRGGIPAPPCCRAGPAPETALCARAGLRYTLRSSATMMPSLCLWQHRTIPA